MTMYSAVFPTTVLFGSNVRSKLSDTIKLFAEKPKVCLVASKSVLGSAPGQDVLKQLDGILCVVFDRVKHDPSVEPVDEIRHAINDTQSNIVVALGGGSVMDSAKTAAFLAGESEPTARFLAGECPLPASGLPCIALPTTAGTGAEITKNAVLSDYAQDVKKSIRATRMAPVAALCDPDFTLNLPPHITAHSGMDALTQAIESYMSANGTDLTRPLAAKATSLLLHNLKTAYLHPGDLAARTAVAEGSMLTALAFAQSGLGSVHGLAHPIGHLLELPHGLTCAILLPHCIKENCNEQTLVQYNELAVACGLQSAGELFETIADLNRSFDIPETFGQYGLKPSHQGYILANCRSGSMKSNPVPMTDETIVALLEKLQR